MAAKMSTEPSDVSTQDESPTQDVSIDDFLTGLMAALAIRHVVTVSLKGEEFYRAVERTFEQLGHEAGERGLDLRFRVFLDPVYRDSPIVRDAISGAVQRDLISLDNPEYMDMRLKISLEEAQLLLDRVPGGEELFGDLADLFLDQYPWVVRTAPS